METGTTIIVDATCRSARAKNRALGKNFMFLDIKMFKLR